MDESKKNQIEKRVQELEEKLAFLDDNLESLNQVIAKQDKELQSLWIANRHLKENLKDLQSGSRPESNEIEPPPPHY